MLARLGRVSSIQFHHAAQSRRFFSCLRPARGLLFVCALIWPLTGVPAEGRGAARIDIDAPEPLRKLLADHIAVPKVAADPDEGERLTVVRALERQGADLFATEGYFNAGIEVMAGEGGRWRLVATPGARAVIGAVDLQFAGDLASPDAGDARSRRIDELRQSWLLAVGKPFRQADWDAAKEALLQAVASEDYAAARIADSVAEVDPARATVRLSVKLDSGAPFTFGPLEVHGLERYDSALVERFRRFAPGDRYSQDRLLEFQRTLQNTPYFASVLVDIDTDAGDAIRAPVRVRLTEARTKRVTFGAGVSSNNGPRGEITYRDANIFGRGWLFTSGVRSDTRTQLGFADIHLPPNADNYRDSVGVLGELNDNQGLATERAAVGAVRTRINGNIETRWSLGYQRERRYVEQSESSRRAALALTWSWTRRAVDNVLDPKSGLVLSLQLGGASKALLSDQNFVRTVLRAQQYWPVGERDVITLRAEAGITTAKSRAGIPEEFLFRTGGAQTVRGYAYQSIGVREAAAIVGGRYAVSASAEYVRWFSREWGMAVFYDVGIATDDRRTLMPLQSGYGLGLRWRTLAGPIAFDLAYSVRDRKIRPAFSLAIAF